MRGFDLLESWGAATPSPLAEAVARHQEAGRRVFDLVGASPTSEGLVFSPGLLRDAIDMGISTAQPYRPHPRGNVAAREAIAHVYDFPSPDDIILTPGTSFAYWAVFRLLAADSGAEILVPSPTYPLFDDLAALAGCRTRHYHLLHREGRGWKLDPDELAFQITPSTRVIVLVSPHNPTGLVIDADTMGTIGQIAERHNVALVLDEVFRDLIHKNASPTSMADAKGAPLTFTFNGLSKGHVLPSMKVAWMAVGGADARWRSRVLSALEYLLDTMLPVNEIAQGATATLLRRGGGEVRRLNDILRARLAMMVDEWTRLGVPVLRPEGGPYVLVPLPPACDAANLALELIERDCLLVHPGGLYGIGVPHLVTTCVAHPPWGLAAIAARLQNIR